MQEYISISHKGKTRNVSAISIHSTVYTSLCNFPVWLQNCVQANWLVCLINAVSIVGVITGSPVSVRRQGTDCDVAVSVNVPSQPPPPGAVYDIWQTPAAPCPPAACRSSLWCWGRSLRPPWMTGRHRVIQRSLIVLISHYGQSVNKLWK